MRLRIFVVSVTVLTLLVVFLFQENVKAQTDGICDRTHQAENEILAQISSMSGLSAMKSPPPSWNKIRISKSSSSESLKTSD